MRILFVCLGNICRSPTAEGVVRHLSAHAQPPRHWQLDSAGTADYHLGAAPDPRTQRAALKRGVDLSGLRARQVVAEDFQRFDLILAMDRSNLDDLNSIRPRAATATTRLFLDFAPACGLVDVPDPYFGGKAGFETVLNLCEDAGRGLLVAFADRS